MSASREAKNALRKRAKFERRNSRFKPCSTHGMREIRVVKRVDQDENTAREQMERREGQKRTREKRGEKTRRKG